MEGSVERVAAVINGEMPDRPPLFDLLRNDAVIEHFAGRKLTFENARETVYKAYAPAIDATRPMVRVPDREAVFTRKDGREQKNFRWTSWTAHRTYRDSDEYASVKRAAMEGTDPSAWNNDRQSGLEGHLSWIEEEKKKLGDVFFMPGITGPGLMGIYDEVGLEAFSYVLADCPDIIVELLERNTLYATAEAGHIPAGRITAGFLGDDIAFCSGPLFSPVWLREHYFPRLERAISAWHAQGVRVLFHSDGNLNPILDDLVEAGIDGLNPIEVLAGMDVQDIHRRYPHLFLAGGIDVSQLLPFGTPSQVKDAVKQAIDAAEGRIMVGSSTELNNEVPLENFLALREAVLEYTY